MHIALENKKMYGGVQLSTTVLVQILLQQSYNTIALSPPPYIYYYSMALLFFIQQDR